MSPETSIFLTSFTVAENTLLSWPQLDMAAKRYLQAKSRFKLNQKQVDHLNQYLSFLESKVYTIISFEIRKNDIQTLVSNNLYKAHIENKTSASFQEYYFRTLNNDSDFISSNDFFRQFKKRYSLQGIDNGFLDKLEENKPEILKLIREKSLTTLYINHFSQALIKHGDSQKQKDLGSFFAKLVHHFLPNEFCALDNPIKDYFKLKKESFFIAFITISTAYERWATINHATMNDIRKEFIKLDKCNIINHSIISNHKLLDLIFWSKANVK